MVVFRFAADAVDKSVIDDPRLLARNGLGRKLSDLPEADFGPASKSAIKRRIRSAVTQAEAAIANSLHR